MSYCVVLSLLLNLRSIQNKMKHFKLLFFAFILMGTVVGFSSCDDDEPEANIVGTWNVDSIVTTNGSTVTDAMGSGTITFNSNNTGSRNYSFMALGNTLTVEDEFTWDDAVAGELSIINPAGGVESWTRTVDTATAQELSVIQTLNSIATTLDFTLSK